MKYFLARYEILDGVHEHMGAMIIEAETFDEACQIAEAEEYHPDKDNEKFYFSFGGDGMTACTNRVCQEITEEQMQFLERVGLAYRK